MVLGNNAMSLVRIAVAAALLAPVCAVAAPRNDLRDIRIGMSTSALPSSGYGGFSCQADQSKKLPGWDAYRTCPPSADGTRVISFRYDDSGSVGDDKTEVAGQPVELALLIDNDGNVVGIKIDTDPHARLYLRKKAFLFALQIKARFGPDGWTCSQTAPSPTEQPIGGVFFHEHCEKTTPARRFLVDRELFRDPSKDLRDFTSATKLTILGPPPPG
jgi:hypothetical protein